MKQYAISHERQGGYYATTKKVNNRSALSIQFEQMVGLLRPGDKIIVTVTGEDEG